MGSGDRDADADAGSDSVVRRTTDGPEGDREPCVLGIEGTAWAASAAVHDVARDRTRIETDPYQPETGGIDPGEAAEQMRAALPAVIDRVLDGLDGPASRQLDAVAFSQGPGLGPCLRVAGTAARALAETLDLPLVGVNHMLAHCEIGRHGAGFDRPVCLNASGANAHVLGFRGGRYRVLGETADVGAGNAIDKFARHLDWSHPGGPKVENRAREGDYLELPYVVKGMDFSFSGLASAAQDAVDRGEPVADVCRGLQESMFGMLTEVAERALSLTDCDELVLGGGVGQNDRLRAMLDSMCEQRGADFYAPEPRFLRDNAGMIAVLGARMYEAGDTIAVADSRVRPDYRPDEVPVTWRTGEAAVGRIGSGERSRATRGSTDDRGEPDDGRGTGADRAGEDWTETGAEATVEIRPGAGQVEKRRDPREYRHPDLDRRLRRDRTVLEARLTSRARREGVPTPVVYDVDPREARIVFEYVGDRELRSVLSAADPTSERRSGGDGRDSNRGSGRDSTDRTAVELCQTVGEHLARLHGAGIVHGDPTPRNVRVGDRVYLIDFGLGYHSDHVEDFATDLHVFRGSLGGTTDDPEPVRAAVEEGYRAVGDSTVVERLRSVEGRGRYRDRS